MKPLFYRIFKNIESCYRGRNLVYQFIAFLLTYLLVVLGFDFWYFEKTSGIGTTPFLFLPALIGFLFPILVPITMLLYGYIKNNFKIKNTAFALGQSAILGVCISSFYKVFTGRVPHPFRDLSTTLTDLSHQFQFGFYRGGAFQGWPSSHTTVAFATSLALFTLYPENTLKHKVIRYGAVTYAFYIGIGISTNIHWFSDFVAGAILGTIIGISVGKSFLTRL